MTSFLFPPLSLHLWLPAGVMSAMMSVVRRSAMRGYGATAARLTPDQKVGSSNLSALIMAGTLITLQSSFTLKRFVPVVKNEFPDCF